MRLSSTYERVQISTMVNQSYNCFPSILLEDIGTKIFNCSYSLGKVFAITGSKIEKGILALGPVSLISYIGVTL